MKKALDNSQIYFFSNDNLVILYFFKKVKIQKKNLNSN